MKNTIFSPSPAKLISLYIIIAIIIVYTGMDSYFQRKQEIKTRFLSEIATITENKAKRIEAWRDERIGDAWVITSSRGFTKAFTEYSKGVNIDENRNIIEERLALYRKYLPYTDIFLLDKNLVLKHFNNKNRLEPEAIENLRKSFSANKPVFSSIFLSEIDSSVYVDIAAPLYLNEELVGGIILRTDPNVYLYPEIQSWPVETETAETGLFTVVGREVLFLSNFRLKENAAFNFKFNIDDSSYANINAVKAAKGTRGKTEGFDYRGKETIAYIREISEQGWIIITKIDQDEVYETLNKNAINQVFVAAFFLLLFGFGLYWIWSNRKKSLLIQWLEDENKIRAIERNYEYFVKYANDVIILSDDNLEIKDVNEQAAKLYGYTKEEMLRMNIKDLKTDELHRILDNRKEEEARLKQGVVYETEHKTKDGKILTVEISLNKIEVEGKIFFQRIIRDITERKITEARLHEEYNLRTAIEESMSSGIAIVDNQGKQTLVNTAFANMVGWSKEELVGRMPPYLYWPEEELENIGKFFQLTVQGKAPKEGFESIFKRKSGERFYVHFNISPLKNINGEAIGWLAVVNDISLRKAAEEKLHEEYNLRTSIEESMSSGIAVVDTTGRQSVIINTAFANMVGWSKEELTGATAPFVYWPEEELENINKMFQLTIQGKAPKEGFEMIFKRRSGERFYVQFLSSELKNINGETIGWLGVFNDITERKAAEEKLRESDKTTKALINATTDSVLMIDMNGIVLATNDEVARRYGHGKTKDDLIGLNAFDLITPEERKRRGAFVEAVIKEKKHKRFTEFDETTGVVYEHSLYPIFDDRGSVKSIAIYFRDITQSTKAAEELRKSEEKYRSIFENIQDVFHQINASGIVMEISPSVENLLGYKREEVIGRHISDFYYSPPEAQAFREAMLKEGSTGDYEFTLKDKAGNPVPISVTARLIRDSEGNHTGAEGIFRNISERKKYEETLIESERRYRTLVETMHDGIMQVDNDDKIMFVNESTCRIFGYSREELIGKKSNQTIIHPDDRNIVVIKNQLREKGYSDSYEIRGRKKTGELLWLNISGTPMYDNRGNVIGSVGFIIDITERKQNEAEILKISHAINQSPIMILIADRYGNIEYINPKVTEVTGYGIQELIGKNPRIFKSGFIKEDEYKTLWKTISSGKEWNGEFYNKKRNGEFYWERVSISCIKDSNGLITHYISVKEDVTAAKEKELELIKAKEKAVESEKLKSAFLANMSHELRTPMVGILGFSELLKESAADPEQLEFAETINKSGKRLMETLNLVLDLSRIEAGKLDVNRKNINIVPLVKESFNNFMAAARIKNLDAVFTSSSEEIIAYVDEKLLFESVNNIINNAVKYTKEGNIEVEVETGKRDAEEIAVIRVKDTGIGIPKESIGLIFEEFRQASEGYGRVFEGTGLGLTIAKNFIEKTGGRIYVESEENKGSVFTIEIPLLRDQKIQDVQSGEVKKDSEIAVAPGTGKRHRVLCIEDEESTRFFIKQLLKDNYEITFANNGDMALEAAKKREFDIVLMDINLGKGMNGIDVTKELRNTKGLSDIRIIAITAYAMKGDKEKFLKAGMNNYISKPFTKNELMNVLNEEILAIGSRN